MKKKYAMILGVVIILIIIFHRNIEALLGFIPHGSVVFTPQNLLNSRIYFWGMAIFLFLYAHFIEKQNLFLYKPNRKGFWFYLLSFLGIGASILILSNIILSILKVTGHLAGNGGDVMKNMLTILQAHPLLLLFTCITAGVTEEIIFRGYLQTRIELIFKSPLAGIIISAIFFSLAHSTYGTAQEIAIPFMIGIIFSVYYFKYRNIYILMAFHFLFDYVQLMMSHS